MAEAQISETVQPQVAANKHSPLRKTIGDIVRSMALVGGVVAAILLVTWRPSPDPIREVDSYPVAVGAAQVMESEVLIPQKQAGWRATSARLEPTEESADSQVWFNGWVSEGGEYFALVQSPAAHSGFVEEQTADGEPVELADAYPWPGQQGKRGAWVAYESPDGKSKSFVRFQDGQTTIVTTSARWSELGDFAKRLSPVVPS